MDVSSERPFPPPILAPARLAQQAGIPTVSSSHRITETPLSQTASGVWHINALW